MEESKRNKEKIDQLNAQGDVLFSARQFTKALNKYKQAAKLIDEDPCSHIVSQAKILKQRNDHAIAADFYAASLEIDPEDMHNLASAVANLSYLGRYSQALKLFEKYPLKSTDSQGFTSYWANKGDILNNLGNFQEALKCYNQALKYSPENILILYNHGEVLGTLGDLKEARNSFEKVIKNDPTSLGLGNSIAYGYALLANKDGKASDHFKELNRKNPTNLDISIGYGLVLIKEKSYEAAGKLFNSVLEDCPHNLRALTGRADVYRSLKDYDSALVFYEKALKRSPYYADALNGAAQAYVGKKEFENAGTYLKKILERCPKNLTALITQGQISLGLKNYPEALPYFKWALTVDGGNKEVEKYIKTIEKLLLSVQSEENHDEKLEKKSEPKEKSALEPLFEEKRTKVDQIFASFFSSFASGSSSILSLSSPKAAGFFFPSTKPEIKSTLTTTHRNIRLTCPTPSTAMLQISGINPHTNKETHYTYHLSCVDNTLQFTLEPTKANDKNISDKIDIQEYTCTKEQSKSLEAHLAIQREEPIAEKFIAGNTVNWHAWLEFALKNCTSTYSDSHLGMGATT